MTNKELQDALDASNTKVAELEGSVQTLESEKEELTKEVDDLKKQVDNKKDKASKALVDAEKQVSELSEANAGLLDTITDLKAKLENKTAEARAAGKEDIVKSGNKTYVVTVPKLNIKGEIIAAGDLHKRQDLVDYLIEIESEALAEKK